MGCCGSHVELTDDEKEDALKKNQEALEKEDRK
jgi:hypothetical protein